MNVSSFKWRVKAVFHSVKIFARADFLELKIPRGKIQSISIFPAVKQRQKTLK